MGLRLLHGEDRGSRERVAALGATAGEQEHNPRPRDLQPRRREHRLGILQREIQTTLTSSAVGTDAIGVHAIRAQHDRRLVETTIADRAQGRGRAPH